jgi:predicted RNA-binding Zn ribbon-like protein
MLDVTTLTRLGGTPCLDFANTVEPRNSDEPIDFLQERDDVIRWGVVGGLVDDAALAGAPKQTKGSRRQTLRLREATAARELARARELREAIYAVFAAVAQASVPDQTALGTIQRAYADAVARSELAVISGAIAWLTTAEGVDAVLDAVASDAVDLLHSPHVSRIKICDSGTGCGWLFLDTTRSGTRRWCSMAVCGTRAKAERYRARRSPADR